MDPLSITASAIAVAGVAARLCSILAEIRNDCTSLPHRLHALNNEVQDLRVVLNEVTAVVRDREEHGIKGSLESEIPQLLCQGRDRLVALEELLRRVWVQADGGKKRELLTKVLLWRKHQAALLILQEDIKRVKSSLNILLGVSNSRDMMRLRLDLEQTIVANMPPTQMTDHLETQDQSLKHMMFTDAVLDHHVQVEQRLLRVESLLLSQTAQLQASRTSLGPLYDSSRPPMRTRPVRPISPASEKQIRTNAEAAVGFRLRGYQAHLCTPHCPCSCHATRHATSPSFIKQTLGQLFIGYAGLPILGNKCDTAACERRQVPNISVEYWFPLGFLWSQIIRLRLSYESNLGPSLQLSTLRHVPDTASCVTFAFNGNIQGLRGLFSLGLASPRDVSSTRGYSLLRWALYGQQYEMAKFLMTVGADPEYSPKAWTDDCPRNKAYDLILRGGLPSEAVDILRAISEGNDYIENQNFSRLHKIVLGLSPGDLAEELSNQTPDSDPVDVCDSSGRTPLDWAAARGDESAVITLLHFGADPNHMDKKLGTPLAMAANQGHTVCAQLLLEAGGLVRPRWPEGVKTGNPLNCAARNASDPTLLKILLDYGADIEGSGIDGMTPLLGVARGNSAAHAALLLDYGANINASSRSGKTPLTTAIEYNNYAVLKVLLAKWFDYFDPAACTSNHPSPTRLLETVAKYADLKTVNILLEDSSIPLYSILSGYHSQGGHQTCVPSNIPKPAHFREFIKARAGEFTVTATGPGNPASPSLADLTTAFKTLLCNLESPSFTSEKQNTVLQSIDSKMESGLLRGPVHLGSDQRNDPQSEKPPLLYRVEERVEREEDCDGLLVFEDAAETLVDALF